MNSFLNNVNDATDFHLTENGGLTHSEKSLQNNVYALFAFLGAYRGRKDEDIILLFKNAFEENEELAMKCLFWGRDCRGGAGERKFFRVCYHWLAKNHPAAAKRNMKYIPIFGRWDDLNCLFGTKLEKDMLRMWKYQLALDIQDLNEGKNGVSLAGKWAPSENCSSNETKKNASILRTYLGMTHKQYRKILSALRSEINIVEKLMSLNKWDEIDFSTVPSKAGLIYRNAFARHDLCRERYENFIKDDNTKVKADVLFPYEVVAKAIKYNKYNDENDVERAAINKYWDNLPDYCAGSEDRMLCVVDTSSSMHGPGASAAINVAISLGMYAAERIGGDFHNKYVSFSSRPQLINIEGVDFVDKVERIYRTNLCENTNLEATFDLLLKAARKAKPEDRPSRVVIISDMEIDYMSEDFRRDRNWNWGISVETLSRKLQTMMEKMREKWDRAGIEMPKLVYWNVEARQNNILDMGPNVSYVSGMSPTLFKQILKDVTGWDLCRETILAERYKDIH